VFFTYALVLTDFYGVRAEQVGWYILPFAVGNVLGPVILGRLFDTLGRRPMLGFTYSISGALLALSGYLFALGWLSATAQTVCWMTIFFFASAAASAAYLTAAETFPLEIRALAIAFFYAVGTGVGGVVAPWLFGVLIDTGSRLSVFGGYLFGSALMIAAAVIAARWGVAAERKPLEAVATPLSLSPSPAPSRSGHSTGLSPPSTWMAVPVTYEPASDARNSAMLANSCAVPTRPRGMRLPISAEKASSDLPPFSAAWRTTHWLLSMLPTSRALTSTLCGA